MLARHPEFMCGICEQLLYEPKYLPCTHRFCCACLKTHCVKSGSRNTFPCPTCEKEMTITSETSIPLIELPDNMKTNLIVESQLEKFHKIRQKKNVRQCILCFAKWKLRIATKFCRSCEEYFCNECGNQHWLLRSSKAHRIWLINDIKELNVDPFVRAYLTLMFSAKIKHNSIFTDPSTIDVHKCQITGAAYFPDGKLAVVDTANQKLKLFDRHSVLRSYLDVRCHDVLVVNDSSVVVTCPDMNCIIFYILDRYEFTQEIIVETDEKCYGLCYNNSNSFYAASEGSPVCLVKFEQTDVVERVEIEAGKIPLSIPHYIAGSFKNQMMCISDISDKCVKCVTNIGEIVWERSINDCGAVISFADYFLLCRQNRNTVDLLRNDGEIIKSFLATNDAMSKVAVCVADTWTQELSSVRIAVMDDSDLINVYTAEDPLSDIDWSTYSRGPKLCRRSSSMRSDGVVSSSCNII